MRRLFLSVLGLSMIFLVFAPTVFAAFNAGNFVDCQVVDVDGDGFKDLRFHVTDQIGGGVPGVEVRVKTSSGSLLLASSTNGTGYCIFNNMPSGNYSWETLVGASSTTGFCLVPLEEHGLISEKEAIVAQLLLLIWMSNATEKTKAFYENFSRYVGYDLGLHPYPSSAGENLSSFSTRLFQWYQGLDDCLVNHIADRDVSRILQTIVGVSREICLRTLEASLNPNSLGNVTRVRMSLKGQAENASLINYSMAYCYGNLTIENTILQVPTSNAKIVAALSGIFVSSFDAFAKIPQLEDSVWTFEAHSDDLLVQVCETVNISKNIYDSYVSPMLDFVRGFNSEVDGFATILSESMVAIAGYTLGLMCYLELIYRFDGIGKILSALQSGNLAAIALTIGVVAGFALGMICTALIILGVGSSAIPVIGYAIAAIAIIIAAILERSDYETWLGEVRGAVGASLTKILGVRQTLNQIDTTQMQASARAYRQAAELLQKFSYSSNVGNFSGYSRTLEAYGQKQENLAVAIDETRPVLDRFINDFLSWTGSSGSIRGHLEGFESTWANWTDSSTLLSSLDPAGIDYSSGYHFKKATAGSLEPLPLFKNENYYASWANEPPTLTDYEANQFRVTYYNDTGTFKYTPQLQFSRGSTRTVKDSTGELDVFYRYKFFFDSGTTTYGFPDFLNIFKWGLVNKDVLTYWQDYLRWEYEAKVLPHIQNISRLLEQLSADSNPPRTDLSVSNIRTDPQALLELASSHRVHIGPSTIFKLTSSDAGSGVAITAYRIFNNTFDAGWTTFAILNNSTLTFSMPQDLAGGEYEIEFNSTDNIGNAEQPNQFVRIPQLLFLPIPLNFTIQLPTFVFERPRLEVSPNAVNAVASPGSSLVLNLSVREIGGQEALDNVSLSASALSSVDNMTIFSGQWSFNKNYFRVASGGQTNVTAILDLPPTTKGGTYCGAIGASFNGEMQYVLVNLTVSSAGVLHLESTQNNYASSNLGTITLGTMTDTASHPAPAIWVEPAHVDLTGKSIGDKFNVTVWANMSAPSFTWQIALLFDPTYIKYSRIGYTAGSTSQFYAGHSIIPVSPISTSASVSTGESLIGTDSRSAGSGSLCWIELELVSLPNSTVLSINNTDTFFLDGDLNELVSTKYNALAGTNMASAYGLPSDAQTPRGSYYALYNSVKGYPFHHWETSGDIAVLEVNADRIVITVDGLGGTIKAVYTYWSPCDIDQNLVVDMKDVAIAAKAAFTDPQDALWNPIADITGPAKLPDGKVNMMDIGQIAKHFGDICS